LQAVKAVSTCGILGAACFAGSVVARGAGSLAADQTPDKLPTQQQQQQGISPPSATSISIAGLSSAAADRFNIEINLTAAAADGAAAAAGPAGNAAAAAAGDVGCAASVRVRLGLSWLPSLPQQVLQALHEVLSQQRYLQLLGACLLQPGEC
jgi:hypothetical protein